MMVSDSAFLQYWFKKVFAIVAMMVVFWVGVVHRVSAADKPRNPKVLDFEADLIEGERKAPNMFLEMDIHRPTLDLVLYQRNNFNDFHLAEKNRKPRYYRNKVERKR